MTSCRQLNDKAALTNYVTLFSRKFDTPHPT